MLVRKKLKNIEILDVIIVLGQDNNVTVRANK